MTAVQDQVARGAIPSRAVLLGMFERMTKIKLCDERFRSMLTSGQIRCMYYSPRGQEVIPSAMAACLRPDDYVVTTYRGLHDHLAKGVGLRELWAEFLGRATGTCKGKGGPMHITDPSSGLMVTTGVVGSGTPIAVGLGLSAKMRGSGQVTSVSYGDGASNIGAVHESMNLASIWKLPVIFLVHNNLYAEHTALHEGTSIDKISSRAAAYSMPGVTVDGNDPIAMYNAAKQAVDAARAGEGPFLIEAMTYRFFGHIMGDSMDYMPKEEREAAMAADPVIRYRAWLAESGTASEEDLAAIESDTAAAIDDAVEFALASPMPGIDELYTDVYAEAQGADR